MFKERLVIPARDAQFHCLPAEPKRLEGLDYTLAILHEAGVANRDSYEVLTLAQGKRERSTLVAIRTRGPNLEDLVLLDLRAYASEPRRRCGDRRGRPRYAAVESLAVAHCPKDRPGRLFGHGSLTRHLARNPQNTKENKELRMNEQLQCLLQKLDEPAHRYAELDRYYRGTQPLAFLSPEAKTALGNRFGRMASNIPRLAVTALAERLRITGFTGDTEL